MGMGRLRDQPGRASTPAMAKPPASLTHTSSSRASQGLTLCSVSAGLGVTLPIRIESSSSHVAEGQNLDLNCLVTGQAHAQITWHKRGGSLPARHQVGGRELLRGLRDPCDYRIRTIVSEFGHIPSADAALCLWPAVSLPLTCCVPASGLLCNFRPII